MNKTKIIGLLKTFTKKEIRDFYWFVQSPFYNKNVELTYFYEYLKGLKPAFHTKDLSAKAVFAELYPNIKYDDKKMKYLMSDLLKLAEQFIGIQIYQQQQNLQNCHILSAYLDRKLDKHYQEIYRKARRKLDAKTNRNTDYYYQQYLLADIAEQHFDQQKLRTFDFRLQEVADYFDLFYLSKKLEHSCEMLDRQNVLAHHYNIKIIDDLMPVLQDKDYQSVPSIAIYQHIYCMLKDEDAVLHFQELKQLLKAEFDNFTIAEMKQAHLSAINFCMRQIRKGNTPYQQELLELYLVAIDQKLLFENGFLSPWTFKNVVKLGLILKRLKWTELFIQQYYEQLENRFRKDAYHYSFADLFYHKNNFDKAQEHLNEVEFSDVFYGLDTRQMLSKIYFETNEEESLLSLIASFRIFLKRNQLISEKVKKTYENFLYFLTKLMKDFDPKLLEAEIKNTHLLPDRSWLLKQLEL